MSKQTSAFYEFGPYRLDLEGRAFTLENQAVPLAPKTFELLTLMVQSPGHAFSKQELMDALWPDTFVEEANLSFQISMLRKALGEAGAGWIETVPKYGYRFAADVRAVTPVVQLPLAPLTPVRKGWIVALIGASVFVVATYFILSRGSRTETIRATAAVAPQVRSLTAYHGFETAPSFSPDGTRLAYVWNGEQQDNFDIYVRMIDESPSVRLTTSEAIDYNPVWSPDGRFIAFLRSHDGSTADVLVMPSLGGNERKIGEARPGSLNDPLLAWISHLAWSSDGRSLIVPDADPSTKSQSLFEVSTINGEKRPITRAIAFSMGDDSPSVSPDGRTLAFVRSPTIAASDIFLLSLAPEVSVERSPRRLTFENGYLYNPMWTPDGRDLLYVTYLDGNTVIKRIPVGGTSEPRVVFTVGQFGTSTAISRQGDRLVYSAAEGDLDIAISPLNGTPEHVKRPRRLISSTRTDMSPQISPDGTRIAFASRRSGPMEIWVADREGANAVRLTAGLLYSGAPRWSPDGKALAFGSIIDGNDDIFTVSASGGPVRRVTDDDARDVVASWSRDGHWIYFASNRTGKFEIWKVPERGGPARQVTKDGGYGGFESTDGRQFYYAKGNFQTSLWRVPSDGGDEQPVVPTLHRWSHFAVFDDGIYFVPSISPAGTSALQLYDFATRTIRSVANIQAHPAPGLAISPDRLWMLYVVHERLASDLMLLEHFR